jgi:hypothetical protein
MPASEQSDGGAELGERGAAFFAHHAVSANAPASMTSLSRLRGSTCSIEWHIHQAWGGGLGLSAERRGEAAQRAREEVPAQLEACPPDCSLFAHHAVSANAPASMTSLSRLRGSTCSIEWHTLLKDFRWLSMAWGGGLGLSAERRGEAAQRAREEVPALSSPSRGSGAASPLVPPTRHATRVPAILVPARRSACLRK